MSLENKHHHSQNNKRTFNYDGEFLRPLIKRSHTTILFLSGLLLSLCLFIPSIAFAESNSLKDNSNAVMVNTDNIVDTPTEQKPQSIDNQVTQLQTQLHNIDSLLKKQKELPDINVLVAQLDKKNQLLQEQTAKPSKNSISKEISDAVRLSYTTKKAQQSHEAYIAELQSIISQLDDAKQKLQSFQQLLTNPVNQSDSTVTYDNVNELITTTETLHTTQQTILADEDQLIIKAKKAVDTSETLQNTLLQKMEEATADELPVSNLEQVKKKIVTHEVALAQLRAELAKDKNNKSLSELQNLQTNILIKQHELWLYNLDLELLQWIQPVTAALPVGQSMLATEDELNEAYNKTQDIYANIEDKIAEIKVRQDTLNKYTNVIGEKPELKTAYQERLNTLQFLQLQLDALQSKYDQRLSKRNRHNFFTRKKVFQTENFSTHINNIPSSLLKIGYQIKISLSQMVNNIAQNPWQILTVLAIMLLISFLLKRLSRFEYGRALFEKNKEFGLVILFRKVGIALKKHQYIATLCLFIAVIINFIELPLPSFHIIMVLVTVIFSMMLWFAVSRIERNLGVVTKGASLRSNVSLVVLSVCVLLYALSSLSAVAQPLVDFYEKLLMLAIAGAAWSAQRYLRTLQKNTDEVKHVPKSKSYRIYVLFITLLPIVIVIVSLLGVIGYTQLSWMILGHLSILLIVFSLFSLGILVINSVRKQLKLASIKRYKRGVFFAQDIVNPLSLLTKILWFVACANLLLLLVSMWRGDNLIYIYELVQWVFKPLFSINKHSFSLFSIIMMVASPYIVYRIGKWLRTFSFHWLFARISDYGVRHSLSIFSQYVAILIGVLITLKIIGLDLTSFAVFAGALGVGVGLGLQDVAKNFISGILLLIERPLRQGDWVMIDGNEGFVKSIGLRAITLENFDKQEVIIPNGSAVNNSLTNFTHSNKLTRTVLYVGVSYDCEPDKVHGVLNDVLENNENVLTEPGWEIILWEYADSAINYRIQYHIDLSQSQRFATQNAVLKSIWYKFKEEGMEIPYPQRDVYIKNANEAELDKFDQAENGEPKE